MEITRLTGRIAAALLLAGSLALTGCTGSAGAPAGDKSKPQQTEAPAEPTLDVDDVKAFTASYAPGGRAVTVNEFADPDDPWIAACGTNIAEKDDLDIVQTMYGEMLKNTVWIDIGLADSAEEAQPFADSLVAALRDCEQQPTDMVDAKIHEKGDSTVGDGAAAWATIAANTPVGVFYDSGLGFQVGNAVVNLVATSTDPAEARALAEEYAAEVSKGLAAK